MYQKPTHSNSHGEVGERYIKSARTILNALLKTYAASLNDETLHRLLNEVKANANSRLMATETTNNVQSHVLLSPFNLLTMELKGVMPQHESIGPADTYCRKRGKKNIT